MAGQPGIPPVLDFDVHNLEISENVTAWQPSTIVPANKPFTLASTFTGQGIVWQWLKAWGVEFKASYYVEGIGVHADEMDLGSTSGNLNAADDTYGPAETALVIGANTLDEGVYKVACVVTFPGAPGLTGFFDSLMIQVY